MICRFTVPAFVGQPNGSKRTSGEAITTQRERSRRSLSLALQAAVSKRTMGKAVGVLKTGGSVETTAGGRIRLPGTSLKTERRRLQRWEIVARQLVDELTTGTRRTRIPTLRELQNRHGICYVTARKAVDSLARAGIIDHGAKILFARPVPAGSGRSTIAVFTAVPDDPPAAAAIYRDRTRVVTTMLERECAEGGLRVRFETLDPSHPGPEREKIRRLNQSDEIIGTIVNPVWSAGGAWNEDLLALMGSLASGGKPMAVFDQTRTFPSPLLRRGANVRIFRAAGSSAGRCVASALLARGHRRVAFVSDWHRFSWSRERLEGMREVFALAPEGSALLEFTSEQRDGPFQLTLNAMRLDNKDFEGIFGKGTPANELARLRRRFNEVRNQHLFSENDRREIDGHVAEFLQIRSLLDKDFKTEVFTGIRDTLNTRLYDGVSPIHSRALFDRAMADASITAWVFPTETNAIEGLDYLQRKGVSVPERISVTSFDNTPIAFDRELASYDFNMAGFVQRALGFIFGPSRTRLPFREEAVEIEGMFIDRASMRSRPAAE